MTRTQMPLSSTRAFCVDRVCLLDQRPPVSAYPDCEQSFTIWHWTTTLTAYQKSLLWHLHHAMVFHDRIRSPKRCNIVRQLSIASGSDFDHSRLLSGWDPNGLSPSIVQCPTKQIL